MLIAATDVEAREEMNEKKEIGSPKGDLSLGSTELLA